VQYERNDPGTPFRSCPIADDSRLLTRGLMNTSFKSLLTLATFASGSLLAATAAAGVSGSNIASLALANVGDGACSTNSAGSQDYETSCTGNGGQPEYWCSDFAMWVWAQAGVDVSALDAAAGTFYLYGQNNGTLSNSPTLGDAVVFNYEGNGYADHVAIVTQVNSDGSIETVSGDWGGTGATEAAFSSTSAVVWNTPAYAGTVGTVPSIMGMTISGFIAPIGLSGTATSVDAGEVGVGTACTVTATGAMGICQDTTTCASMGGTSTADYCPGPDNVECCTGVPVASADAGAQSTDAGTSSLDAAAPDPTPSADAGTSAVPPSVDAGKVKVPPPPTNTTDAGVPPHRGTGASALTTGAGSDDATAASAGGCSVTRREGPSTDGYLWLAALGVVVLTRRKRAARVRE
jgi:surface antigen